MYGTAQYCHPEIEPYSRGAVKEIVYSWIAAIVIVSAVLLAL